MRKTIEDLENASISNNSRILELERELLSLESKLKEWQIPVIPLKKATIPQNPPVISPKTNLPDMSLRKQLLRKNDENRHSASR